MNTPETRARYGASTARDKRRVQTVYMPRGNTAPQYSGSYRSGNRITAWRQMPRMTSIGIHHVAVAHQNKVKPLTNGKICPRSGESGASSTSMQPASVEIAAAPMFIQ